MAAKGIGDGMRTKIDKAGKNGECHRPPKMSGANFGQLIEVEIGATF